MTPGACKNDNVKYLTQLYSWQTWNAWFLHELAVAPSEDADALAAKLDKMITLAFGLSEEVAR